MIEIRLLGPVEVCANNRTVDIGPPQRRSVLAALAVDAHRPVQAEVLVDRVWGASPPRNARRALYSHISRLRQVLAAASGDDAYQARLARSSGDYVLDVAPESVDLHRFRAAVDRARSQSDPADERAAALRSALALWHGEPLRGIPGEWAEQMRDLWLQQRLDVAIAWAHAELVATPDMSAISQLHELVTEHPFAEPLVSALMQALHAAGRTAEAVEVYARTRQRLADALGTEPGPVLRTVHQAILRGEERVGAVARA